MQVLYDRMEVKANPSIAPKAFNLYSTAIRYIRDKHHGSKQYSHSLIDTRLGSNKYYKPRFFQRMRCRINCRLCGGMWQDVVPKPCCRKRSSIIKPRRELMWHVPWSSRNAWASERIFLSWLMVISPVAILSTVSEPRLPSSWRVGEGVVMFRICGDEGGESAIHSNGVWLAKVSTKMYLVLLSITD
jgi:hypothetical protein